jgi:hypothetical protein
MKWSSLGATARLWWSLALLALLALAPFLCTLAAALVAFVLRCDLDEGNIFPCLVFGVDLGYPLHFFAIMMFWVGFFTFPIAAIGFLVWLGFAVVLLVRRLRRSEPA